MKKYLFLITIIIVSFSACVNNDASLDEPIRLENNEYINMCQSLWGTFSKTITQTEVESIIKQNIEYSNVKYIYEGDYLISVAQIKNAPNLTSCIVYRLNGGEYHFWESAIIDSVHTENDYKLLKKGDFLSEVLKIDTATQLVFLNDNIISYHHCKNKKTVCIEYKKTDDKYCIKDVYTITEPFCFVDYI